MPTKVSTSAGLLILGAADVDATLTPAAAVEMVEDVFRRRALGKVQAPALLGFHVEHGGFHTKVAAMRLGQRAYFAAKTNGNFPSNPERLGLPCIQGIIILSDADSGTPLAIMDSVRITELRTAAATAVAARHLAKDDAESVALIGCGAQARSQLAALDVVRPIGRLRLYDLVRSRAEELAAWAATQLSVAVDVAPDCRTAVEDADVCITCTTSTRAILHRGSVPAGAFIAAVGADSPAKQELDPGLLATSKVVVDSLEQCETIGDLHHAIAAGAMSRDDVHAELGDVITGRKVGREHANEIVVFDSTGTALQDVAAAAFVYERALECGMGVTLDIGSARSHHQEPAGAAKVRKQETRTRRPSPGRNS
jgi:alanine dehydrogenase